MKVRTRLDRRYPVDIETLVYRTIREVLINVRKHARAANVSISLVERRGGLHAAIRDDGRGIPLGSPRVARPPTSGLDTARERLRAMTGSFDVTSVVGEGTTVEFQLPLPDVATGPFSKRRGRAAGLTSAAAPPPWPPPVAGRLRAALPCVATMRGQTRERAAQRAARDRLAALVAVVCRGDARDDAIAAAEARRRAASSRPRAPAAPPPAGASSASSRPPTRPAGGRGRTARARPPRRSCPPRSRPRPPRAAPPGARTRASRPPTDSRCAP